MKASGKKEVTVKVRFIAPLKDFTGTEMVELESSFNTFEKVMTELLRFYPRLKAELFNADGLISYACHIMLNGKPVYWPRDKDIRVNAGDELLLMRFIAGG